MTPFRPDPKHKRIALKRNSKAWLDLVKALFERDNYTCFWCGRIFPPEYLAPCHIVSVGAGGDDALYNLLTGCSEDHGKDHNGEFLKKGKAMQKEKVKTQNEWELWQEYERRKLDNAKDAATQAEYEAMNRKDLDELGL